MPPRAPALREARSGPRKESFLHGIEQLRRPRPILIRHLLLLGTLAQQPPGENENPETQKQERPDPEEQRRGFHRRTVEYELAVARYHHDQHLALACASA